ncbi:MAG: PilX N-terminal domain-containing pilus assembly protein [Arenicellales bacterium]
MTRSVRRTRAPASQQGIVLVIGLVFLLVLTIIGITSLRTTTLEERMAGNLQQHTIAFQDAEAKIALVLNSLNGSQSTLSTDDSCATLNPGSYPAPVNPSVVTSYHTCDQYLGTSEPGRLTNTAEGSQTYLLHFRIESESTTAGHANVTLQQGIYQRGPRSPSILEE